ncbi:uncharacterized protein LOC116339741 [Contarinia nasturtii]|uniref:uncharacterized protein LOC116339741 n=1 Tax=Contarinia nasturtii TaxID=265458 RepID=UPI0012D441DB|nr:uncharacterized protein LOC116339741 [Contarinia nasturtii]
MKSLFCFAVIVAAFGTLAFPSDVDEKYVWVRVPKTYLTNIDAEIQPLDHIRSRRSPEDDRTKIYAEGNHNRKAGTNVYVQGEQRVWQSPNKLNEVHVNGNYGQHFGGPGGRSPPSFGGGVTYTRRF